MQVFYFIFATAELWRLIMQTEVHPRTAILVKTLKKSFDELLHFLYLLVILLVGYMGLAVAQFAGEKAEFSMDRCFGQGMCVLSVIVCVRGGVRRAENQLHLFALCEHIQRCSLLPPLPLPLLPLFFPDTHTHTHTHSKTHAVRDPVGAIDGFNDPEWVNTQPVLELGSAHAHIPAHLLITTLPDHAQLHHSNHRGVLRRGEARGTEGAAVSTALMPVDNECYLSCLVEQSVRTCVQNCYHTMHAWGGLRTHIPQSYFCGCGGCLMTVVRFSRQIAADQELFTDIFSVIIFAFNSAWYQWPCHR